MKLPETDSFEGGAPAAPASPATASPAIAEATATTEASTGLKLIKVFCRKPGSGLLRHQRKGSFDGAGVFTGGELFEIAPGQTKAFPEDVANDLLKHFPSWIITDEEARADALRTEAVLKEKDTKIESLQGTLDSLHDLAARAARGEKKAAVELAALLSSARSIPDPAPAKQQPPPAPTA